MRESGDLRAIIINELIIIDCDLHDGRGNARARSLMRRNGSRGNREASLEVWWDSPSSLLRSVVLFAAREAAASWLWSSN